MTEALDASTAERISHHDRVHVLHPWSAYGQGGAPVIASAQGRHVTLADGRRLLDLTSQLVNVNLGYQHPKLLAAIRAATTEVVTVSPAQACASRSEAARLIAELAPGDLDVVFFTNGGAEAIENAVRLARLSSGRHKVLSTYRSYHGATAGAITVTGEARRWPSEPGLPGVVHFWGPYLYRSPFHAADEEEEAQRALAHLRTTVEAEGPGTIAAIVLESVPGTNGVLVPPPGYLAGVRRLCDEYGICFVADEVMAGFGRCGQWFAVDHWGVVPDMITFAKGVNSGYVPLGGVVLSRRIAEAFTSRPYPGGLTYAGHPLACASAVASIGIMREEGVVEHAARIGREVLGPGLAALAQRHPLVGEARGLGVMWALELVADRATRTPLSAEAMAQVADACRRHGVWPMIAANRVHVVPPCTITDEEARTALAALDAAVAESDHLAA